MRKLAIAQEASSRVVYAWQSDSSNAKASTTKASAVQKLWDRRAQLLKTGLNSKQTVWDEWLALTFALDATVAVSSSSPGSKNTTPASAKYEWAKQKGQSEYAALLLQRRKEMLKMNLTHSPELQV